MPRIGFYHELSCPWSSNSSPVLEYIDINYISVSHSCFVVYAYSNEVISLQTTNTLYVRIVVKPAL